MPVPIPPNPTVHLRAWATSFIMPQKKGLRLEQLLGVPLGMVQPAERFAALAPLHSNGIEERNLGQLTALTADILGFAETQRSVLVIEDPVDEGVITSAMEALGAQVASGSRPLDVIPMLQDATLNIGLVIAPLDSAYFETLGLFAFLDDEFPLVRRVGYLNEVARDGQDVLHRPLEAATNRWSPLVNLAVQIAPALARAWDPRAEGEFSAAVRKHTPRIREAARSMGFDQQDAEDIAQDALLGLYVDGVPLDHLGPDLTLRHLTTTSMHCRQRGNVQREELASSMEDRANHPRR